MASTPNVCDLFLAAAYFTISAAVWHLHRRLAICLRIPDRPRLESLGITLAWLLGGFIMTCGLTHGLKAAGNMIGRDCGDLVADALASSAVMAQLLAAIVSAAAAVFFVYHLETITHMGAHMEVHPRGAIDVSLKALQLAREEERQAREASEKEQARLRDIQDVLTSRLGQQLEELGKVAQGVREATFLREFRAISAQVADASATVIRHVTEQRGVMDNAVAAGLKVQPPCPSRPPSTLPPPLFAAMSPASRPCTRSTAGSRPAQGGGGADARAPVQPASAGARQWPLRPPLARLGLSPCGVPRSQGPQPLGVRLPRLYSGLRRTPLPFPCPCTCACRQSIEARAPLALLPF